jgi:hypothetical protein
MALYKILFNGSYWKSKIAAIRWKAIVQKLLTLRVHHQFNMVKSIDAINNIFLLKWKTTTNKDLQNTTHQTSSNMNHTKNPGWTQVLRKVSSSCSTCMAPVSSFLPGIFQYTYYNFTCVQIRRAYNVLRVFMPLLEHNRNVTQIILYILCSIYLFS